MIGHVSEAFSMAVTIVSRNRQNLVRIPSWIPSESRQDPVRIPSEVSLK